MNFPANAGGSVGGGVSIRALIDLCLVENERQMAGYDARLLRPTIVPRLAKLVRRFLAGVALPDAARPARASVRTSGAR